MNAQRWADRKIVFHIESLEPRQLLAGVVKMNVNGAGDVILKGDNANNSVEVSLRRVEGDFVGVVSGRDGTVIRFRGDTASEHFFDLQEPDVIDLGAAVRSTRGDIRVNLKGGDDRIEFASFEDAVQTYFVDVGGSLNLKMGSGDDRIKYQGNFASKIGGTQVVETTRINTGSGNDEIDLSEIFFSGRLEIRTGKANSLQLNGSGHDEIRLTQVGTSGSTFIRGGKGASETVIERMQISDNDLSIKTGGGADSVSLSRVVGADGDIRIDVGTTPTSDNVDIGESILGNLSVLGRSGTQNVRLGATDSPQTFWGTGSNNIKLGSGDDRLELAADELSILSRAFVANMGSGEDFVEIGNQSRLDDGMRLLLGSGDDELRFGFSILSEPLIRGQVILNGGSGFDRVVDLDIAEFDDSPTLISIEDNGI